MASFDNDIKPIEIVHSNESLFRGVFLNDVNDSQKQRQFLIDIKDHVAFSTPPVETSMETLHLKKEINLCTFKNLLQRYGLQTTIETIDSLKFDAMGKTPEEEVACSDVCVNSVKLAEWMPSITDFSLSSFALEYLQKIEMIMADDLELAKSKCLLFFEIYGSHFYHCKYTFGGMFIVGASCRNASLHTDQNHTMAASNIFKSIFSKKKIQEEISEMCSNLHFSHEGGDEGHCKTGEFDHWKNSLKGNKKSWKIIDKCRLTSNNHIGVWTLVKMQHGQFVDAKKLSGLLSSCWLEKISENSFAGTDIEKSKQTIREVLDEFDLKTTKEGCSSPTLLAVGQDVLKKLKSFENRFGIEFMFELDLQCNPAFKNVLFRIMEQKGDRTLTSLLLEFLSFCKTFSPTSSFKEVQKDNSATLLSELKKYFQSEHIGFNGYMSTKKLHSVEELFFSLDTELLRDLVLFRFCPVEILGDKELAIILDADIKCTVETLFKTLLTKKDVTQSMLLCVVALSLGFDLSVSSSTGIKMSLEACGLERSLVTGRNIFQNYQKYLSKGTDKCQAWILVQLIFLCDSEKKRVESFRSFWKKNQCILTENISKHLERISEDEQHKLHKHTNDLISICGLRMENEIQNLLNVSLVKMTDNSKQTTKSKSITKILKSMEMEKYFSGKLTIEDVMQIRDTIFDQPKQISDLPWAILRTIISIDYSFRDNILNDFFRRANDQAQRELSSSTENSKKNKTTRKQSKLHPSDVLLAIFLCCDPFLKRLLAQKMFVCKIAIPVIFPDFGIFEKKSISLWPMRDIFLDGSPESVVTKNLKSVSFMRIGDVNFQSKSNLINKLISENDHSSFFHKDCPLGSVKRLVSNGTVEVTWYIPKKATSKRLIDGETNEQSSQERKDKEIDEALTIFNLRGDASKHESLVDILLHMSNIMIVLVTGKILHGKSEYQPFLQKIHQSNCKVIILTDLMFEDNMESDISSSGDEEDSDDQSEDHVRQDYVNEEEFKKNYSHETGSKNPVFFCSVIQKNFTEIKEYLKQKIIDLCRGVNSTSCLEEQILTLPSLYLTDEENYQYKIGRALANDIFSNLHILARSDSEQIHAKKFVLPLQCGKLWPLWSQLQKEENRTGKKGKYDMEEKQKHQMRNIRAWQILSFGRETDVFSKFINTLDEFVESRDIISYFLACLKQKLDYQSRTVLPTLASVLYNKFTKYEESRSSGTPNDDELRKMKEEIYTAEKNLANASFGLEHFFREMGQVYESFMTFEDKTGGMECNTISRLPKIAAKLLTFGQPLEIMDGDASNIPLVWVKAVFNEINSLFQSGKKLIVISVLGIQSSGKSTLLNTMFGLQFAVSAGRCTRGIFLQVVPVDKEKSTLPFDYALIVDTEGLRAPELAGEKMHHDNELATFVIGLADVAIINIKGETIAEMEDVLQIVVHALIRLKHANEKISLQQTCIFVHQNVSAQNAFKETFQGSQKTVQNLDKMTNEAANEEGMVNIKCFKDVIQFDPIHHIFQIPDLWHGSPPMAPASRDYSEKAVEVFRTTFFDIVRKRHTFMRFTEINNHLVSLWKSILSEDFVFSFRNVLEIKAFNILEKKFQSLCWSLEELKLKYIQEKIRPKLGNCKCQEEINKEVSALKDTFQNLLTKETTKCLEDLETFFKNAELSEYMVHWKGRKENELKSTSKEIGSDIYQKLDLEAERCGSLFKTKDNLSHIRTTLTNEAIELAKKERGKELLVSELKNKFEAHWLKWLNKYAPDNIETIISKKTSEMKSDLVAVLFEKFSSHSAILETSLEYQDISNMLKNETPLTKTINISDIKENCISICGVWNNIKNVFTAKTFNDFKGPAIKVIHDIFRKIEDYFKVLGESAEYDHTQFSKAIKHIVDDIDKHNSDKGSHGFTITPYLEIKIAVTTAGYSFHRFAKMIGKHEKTNSIRFKMNEMKKEIKDMFNDVYEAKANEILVTKIVSNALKPIIKERICRRFTVDVVTNITMGKFGNMKFPLLKEIMTDLAQKSDFMKFMTYILNTEEFVIYWIYEFTINEYKRTGKDGKLIFDSSITQLINHAITDIRNSCPPCTEDMK